MPKNEVKNENMERAKDLRLQLVRHGIKYYELAAAIGIAYSSLNRWMRNGMSLNHYQQAMDALKKMGGEL